MGRLNKFILVLGVSILGLGSYTFIRYYFDREMIEVVSYTTGIIGTALAVFEIFRKK